MKEERFFVGWLAPNGEHFVCNSYGHDELTQKLIKEYFKDESYMTPFESDDYLFDRGWCRISITGLHEHGYHLQMKWRHVTENQKQFIREMCEHVGNFITESTRSNLEAYEIIGA